jgi:hypothetical protein
MPQIQVFDMSSGMHTNYYVIFFEDVDRTLTAEKET